MFAKKKGLCSHSKATLRENLLKILWQRLHSHICLRLFALLLTKAVHNHDHVPARENAVESRRTRRARPVDAPRSAFVRFGSAAMILATVVLPDAATPIDLK